MPTILGVIGSPRANGNTARLVHAALDGARSTGCDTSPVFLGDLTIGECTGCHACWRGRDCPRGDDMNRLYVRIAEASGIIFGTPVYWYGPIALMKAFLDRFVRFNCPEHRSEVHGKPAAVVVPFEDTTPETADLTLALFTKSLAWLKMPLAGTVIAPGVTLPGEVAGHTSVIAEARRLGETMAAIALSR